MIYEKIHELKRHKLNKSQISKVLGIDFKTVNKYWNMPPDDFAKARQNASCRHKKADIYKDYVIECLQTYPDMTAAQIYDWIKEQTGKKELEFQERSFRNYVVAIRKDYGIKKPERTRQYEATEDPPLGKQAQIDMGEIILKTASGRNKKVYCFGMVLSNSRQKYGLWREKPWTTRSFIEAHIKAFEFFGGRPQEIVYDQDKVLAVSENHGDIIYTDEFQIFKETIGFDVFLCHGADPESKGRIENVVKYLKHGFAEHRVFEDIDSFNEACIAWLERTGNGKINETTKKIPAEVFALEKEYLKPVSEYSFAKPVNASIDYLVRKDNVVLYKSNRYRVPKGTYSKGKKVHILPEGSQISIVDAVTGEIYATHPICLGKGELIGSSSHDRRDMSQSLKELDESVKALFDGNEAVADFLSHVHEEKIRYYRDQLLEIRRLYKEWDTDTILDAVDYCRERSLYSASELKSAIYFLSQYKADSVKVANAGIVLLPEKYRGGSPPIRELSLYETVMERSRNDG
jgi:transposase